jgi:hypothetical protein
MFVLDDLLLAPGKAAMFLMKELARKAQEEWLDDDAIKQELQELYTLFEAGRITDKDFEARECRLLERLEQIAKAKFQQKWGGADIETEATVHPIEAVLQAEAPPMLPPTPAPVIDITPPAPDPAARPRREVMPLLDDVLAGLLDRREPPEPAAAPPPPLAPMGPVAPAPVAPVAPAPVAPVAPAPVAPIAPAPVAPAPEALQAPQAPEAPARLSIAQVIDRATQQLSILKLRVSTIASVAPEDGGWRVTAELVERRGVPDTNDFLGVYDLHLDESANVLRYERTHLRRRSDLGR